MEIKLNLKRHTPIISYAQVPNSSPGFATDGSVPVCSPRRQMIYAELLTSQPPDAALCQSRSATVHSTLDLARSATATDD
jgi:hypothetical protein